MIRAERMTRVIAPSGARAIIASVPSADAEVETTRASESFRWRPAAEVTHRGKMKPLPAPPVPGNSDAERFDNAVRKTFTVSKEEMQRQEAEWQRTNGKKPSKTH